MPDFFLVAETALSFTVVCLVPGFGFWTTTPGMNYNFPLFLFGLAIEELEALRSSTGYTATTGSSTVSLRALFIYLLGASAISDVSWLVRHSFSYGGQSFIIYLISLFILLLKLPIFLTIGRDAGLHLGTDRQDEGARDPLISSSN